MNGNLKKRDIYLNQLIAFKDTEMIKVITGIRRCGKSSLLRLMTNHLKETGILPEQIIEMNFESMQFVDMDVKGFYQHVSKRIQAGKKTYLFFDEIQKIKGWEDAVNSFRVDFDCDIYITGSNAYLLSSELSTYLSGRYVEIKVLPLSFHEFLDFHGYAIYDQKMPNGDIKKRVKDKSGEIFEARDVYNAYVRFGGMPMLADIGLDVNKVIAALDGVYSAAIVNDILERDKRKGERMVSDAILLRKIIMFLADNIGNSTSATSIGNTLKDEGIMADHSRKGKPSTSTILFYIDALIQAYVFYEIRRFDIKGKEYLRTLGKYYIVDTGLRSYLLGYRGGDRGHILENIIYFELLRRHYDVAVGKISNLEIDFIATKADELIYIQVTENMNAPETRERELKPLRMVRDNHRKMVIMLEGDSAQSEDGIQIVNAMDYLLG